MPALPKPQKLSEQGWLDFLKQAIAARIGAARASRLIPCASSASGIILASQARFQTSKRSPKKWKIMNQAVIARNNPMTQWKLELVDGRQSVTWKPRARGALSVRLGIPEGCETIADTLVMLLNSAQIRPEEAIAFVERVKTPKQ